MTSEDNTLSFADFESYPVLPFNINENFRFSVSLTFGPTGPASAAGIPIPVDMMLLSNDFVVFCTHEATLLNLSNNFFQCLLPLPTPAQGVNFDSFERILYLSDIPSSELEIMLQAVHNPRKDSSSTLINIDTLIRGIDHLSQYGIFPDTVITPTSYLYKTMLSCAPLHPLEVYALAAQYGLTSLAVTVSSHTLVLELFRISHELSERMGSVYMLRLFALHLERTDRLKVLLVAEMGLHNPTVVCDFTNQKRLKEGWNLAVASLLFSIKPGTTSSAIKDEVMEFTSTLTCPDCLRLRDTQLNKVVVEWSMTRRTINV